jgi:TonB family protein
MRSLPLVIATAPAFDPLPWLALGWLLGTVGCAALFVRQQRRFVRSLGHLSSCDDGTAQAQTTAGCPALVGAWRPRIVLPADFERRYDNAERELILAHERAHRARGDAQANALAAALRCLYWFNPLFHFAASRLRFDQELACDAIVISRFPEARRPYADAMLKTQLADLGLPAGCHWQSSHPLKERIAMLKKPLPGRARTALGLGLVAVLAAGGSYAAWAAQPAQSSVIDPDAPAAQRIHADVVLRVDDAPLDLSWASHDVAGYLMRHDPQKAPSDWEFGFISGRPFFLEIFNGKESWRIDGTVRPAADHTFELESTLTHNGSIVSRPKLIARDGEPAGIKIGEKKGGKFKGLGAQFTFRDAKSPIADAKRVQSEIASVVDVSYRRLTRIAYPQSAIAAKAQGVVYIAVHVGTDGKVVEAKVSSVMPMSRTDLADAALAAVKNWTFDPRKIDGKAVVSDTTVAIAFSLDPNKPLAAEPGILDSIRVSPPLAEAVTPAESLPASENLENRLMHPPKYPESAIKAHQQGKVVLKVHVDVNGNPVETEVTKTDPPEMAPDLTNSAIGAVMQWRFNPARKDGKAVDGWVSVPITFSLTEM